MTLFFIVQCNMGLLFTVWGPFSSLHSFIERSGNLAGSVLFRTNVIQSKRGEYFFHFSFWYSEHSRTLVKIIIWCIFYVGVASGRMLCNEPTRLLISCIFLVDNELVIMIINTRPQKVLTMTDLDNNKEKEALFSFFPSLILSVFLSFFLSFFQPSCDWPRLPPKPYKEGRRCTCSVCLRRVNVSAIISPL